MKKTFYFAAVLLMAATSCQKEISQESKCLGNYSVKATREGCADTKASVDGTTGAFTWSKGDNIGLWNGTSFDELTTQDDGKSSATFSGMTTGTPTAYAVFPYALNASVSGSDINVTLPAAYEWKKNEANTPMLATFTSDPKSLSFKHLGGLVNVAIDGVPASASKFVFSTDKDITGEYTVATDQITSGGNAANNEVEFTFSLTETTDMDFYVPVPVGDYKFGVKIMDASGGTMTDFQGSTTNSITRAKLLKMPTLKPIYIVTNDNEGLKDAVPLGSKILIGKLFRAIDCQGRSLFDEVAATSTTSLTFAATNYYNDVENTSIDLYKYYGIQKLVIDMNKTMADITGSKEYVYDQYYNVDGKMVIHEGINNTAQLYVSEASSPLTAITQVSDKYEIDITDPAQLANYYIVYSHHEGLVQSYNFYIPVSIQHNGGVAEAEIVVKVEPFF